MPISISANVLALRHSWGRYGSRTTPARLLDSIANAGPTPRRSSTLLSRSRVSGRSEARNSALGGSAAMTCNAVLRQAWPMTDRDPDATAAAVTRGMQAQLARRDAAL